MVAKTGQWKPVGTTLFYVHVAVGCFGALVLVALAGPLASLMREAAFEGCLRLYAAEIPFFLWSAALKTILVGRGMYGRSAALTSFRWVARLALIILFVEGGLSVRGAIAGSVAACFFTAVVGYIMVPTPLLTRNVLPLKSFLASARHFSLAHLGMRLLDRLDLLALKALGGSIRQAATYGASQGLAATPLLFIVAIGPPLLSTTTRALRSQDLDLARKLSVGSLRFICWLLPLGAAGMGSAGEILTFLFGKEYGPAAPILRILVAASLVGCLYWIGMLLLVSGNREAMLLRRTVHAVALAVPGYLVAIPLLGPIGAALVTLLATAVASGGVGLELYRFLGVLPPKATVIRSLLLAAAALAVTLSWSTPGVLLLVKLLLVVLGTFLAFHVTGEFSGGELKKILSSLPGLSGSEAAHRNGAPPGEK